MKIVEASMLVPMTILITMVLISLSINIYDSFEKEVDYHNEETTDSYTMSLRKAIDNYDMIGSVFY